MLRIIKSRLTCCWRRLISRCDLALDWKNLRPETISNGKEIYNICIDLFSIHLITFSKRIEMLFLFILLSWKQNKISKVHIFKNNIVKIEIYLIRQYLWNKSANDHQINPSKEGALALKFSNSLACCCMWLIILVLKIVPLHLLICAASKIF